MKEAIIYICRNDEDMMEAAELSGLNVETYGKPQSKYPWYMGWREDHGELKSVSTDNGNGNFNDDYWFKNAIELPVFNLYEKLGMKT